MEPFIPQTQLVRSAAAAWALLVPMTLLLLFVVALTVMIVTGALEPLPDRRGPIAAVAGTMVIAVFFFVFGTTVLWSARWARAFTGAAIRGTPVAEVAGTLGNPEDRPAHGRHGRYSAWTPKGVILEDFLVDVPTASGVVRLETFAGPSASSLGGPRYGDALRLQLYGGGRVVAGAIRAEGSIRATPVRVQFPRGVPSHIVTGRMR